MIKINRSINLIIGFTVISSLLGGCAPNKRAAYDYLQRPVRVAILPGINKTDQPEATIVLNKAWETSLKKLGYEVVSADRVVTYASAMGISLEEVGKTPPAQLGKDLKVDAILYTQILRWETSYKIVASGSTVSGINSLVDAPTGAIIWEHLWTYQENSGNNTNNGIAGLLVDALVTATVNAVTDAPTRLAKEAVEFSSTTIPVPGNAPKEPPL